MNLSRSTLRSQLSAFIQKQMELPIAAISIGLEHEFFLCTAEGAPASEHDSQAVFYSLAKTGYRLIGAIEEDFIPGVLTEDHVRFPTRIAYDHPPHLLEISVSPQKTLADLARVFKTTWSAVERAAQANHLRIASAPLLPIAPNDERILTSRMKWRNLRHYRTLLLKGDRESQWKNYAAVIAGTQVHVALSAVRYPGVVETLYCMEPALLSIAAKWAGMDELQIRERWQGYFTVFSDSPLVGFPDMNSWSVQSWATALCHTPIAGGPQNAWAAKTLDEIEDFPCGSVAQFMSDVRDLQIVRPRLWGSVEFRADPAMPTPDTVMRIAALRFGLVLATLDGYRPNLNFLEAHDSWWRLARGAPLEPLDQELIDIAATALKKAGNGEESYLQD